MRKHPNSRLVFVTGSDTGVGKTVLTAALTRRLRGRGVSAVGLKPLCSGGREDARQLRSASGDVIALDEVNPWHFRAALAPVLAARQGGQRVKLADVAARVRAVAGRFEVAVVEGAGGLLSPLVEDGDNLDLLAALRPTAVVVVVPNRLGAVNQARLVLRALPAGLRRRAVLVLVDAPGGGAAARTNVGLLAEFAPGVRVVRMPWLAEGAGLSRRVARALDELADWLGVRLVSRRA
jgi:dethiobiotin synthetase